MAEYHIKKLPLPSGMYCPKCGGAVECVGCGEKIPLSLPESGPPTLYITLPLGRVIAALLSYKEKAIISASGSDLELYTQLKKIQDADPNHIRNEWFHLHPIEGNPLLFYLFSYKAWKENERRAELLKKQAEEDAHRYKVDQEHRSLILEEAIDNLERALKSKRPNMSPSQLKDVIRLIVEKNIIEMASALGVELPPSSKYPNVMPQL